MANRYFDWDVNYIYGKISRSDINNGLPTFNTALGNSLIFRREVNLLNASVTLKMNSGFELGVWGRNLTDDEFITTVFDSVAQSGSVSGYPNAPRTYGVVGRIKF